MSNILKDAKTIDWGDVLKRSVKTFFQSVGSYIILNLSGITFIGNNNLSEKFWVGLLLGGVSAGICGLWNGVISPLLDTNDGNTKVKIIYVNTNNTNNDDCNNGENG